MMANLREVFEDAAIAAGRVIMDVYDARDQMRLKADRSPVTLADERSEEIILAFLHKAFPTLPIVAEEACAAGVIPNTSGKPFLLVDPLDGTKEFIRGRADFTVNIALVEDRVPIAGVVYAPASRVIYSAEQSRAEKVELTEGFIELSRAPISVFSAARPIVAVASSSHGTEKTDAFLQALQVANVHEVGSSLKFCLIAEGIADVYPRFGRTMQWDTAAGDAVLRASGGMTTALNHTNLLYGMDDGISSTDFSNPFFLAIGSEEAKRVVANALKTFPVEE